MTKSHLPYHRLVDPEITRANSAETGLRRSLNTVFVIVVLAVVVVVGVILCLLVFLYFLAETRATSDGLQHATPSPGSSVTGAWLASTPGDLGRLLERVSALEREVAILKSERRACDYKPDRGPDHSQTSSDEETSGFEPHDGQEKPEEHAELGPSSMDPVTPSSSSSVKGSLISSTQTSSEKSSVTQASPDWLTSRPEAGLLKQNRQPRSRDRQKPRQDRSESLADPADLLPPGLQRHPPDSDDRRDGSGADTTSTRERKKNRPIGVEHSGGRRRGFSCRHCIDNDKITNSQERHIETRTSQETANFGRAVHIQGNRNGNIPIGNDGWVRGFQTWKKADWASATTMDQYFDLGLFGTVTVVESGLYYVYSQILFYDSNDTVGQSICINGEAHFTCTKSNISAEVKQSTCYVGGVVQLLAGDQVGIKLSIPNVTIALYADTSYFGLFRVAQVE